MERLRAAFVTEAKPMLQRTFDFLLAIWCVDRSYEGWFWSVEQRWGIREVHLNSTYHWQGLPLGWCSPDIKDLLHDVDGLMMMIMYNGGGGGHYDRWRVANSLRVPLPGQWGWCQQVTRWWWRSIFLRLRNKSTCLSPCPPSIDALVLKGRMQIVKVSAAVNERSNKSWKGRWHTLAAQNILTFISSFAMMVEKVLSSISAVNHCPVFDEEVCKIHLLSNIKP